MFLLNQDFNINTELQSFPPLTQIIHIKPIWEVDIENDSCPPNSLLMIILNYLLRTD